MRQINWDKPLSEEDVVWLRQSGQPDVEDRIQRHQEKFDADVPEAEVPAEDSVTNSALDPQARIGEPAATGDGARLVDPTEGDAPSDEDDDYDQWSKADLEAEVAARNTLPDTSEVVIEGTGSNGNITKPDLIKGLRLWDQENPGALEDNAPE